jgi:hypothetical protein
MTEKQITQFLNIISLEMPRLFDPEKVRGIDYGEDETSFVMELPVAMHIDRLQNEIDDCDGLMLMYYFEPSNDTVYGHRCCAYSLPTYGRMFKLNAIASSEQMCSEIYVTLYESAEVMRNALQEELHRLSTGGELTVYRDEVDILQDFL